METGEDNCGCSCFLGVSGIIGVLTTFSFEGVDTFKGMDLAGELLKIFSTGLLLDSA